MKLTNREIIKHWMHKMNRKAYIEKCLADLQTLGIDVAGKKQSIIDGIISYPADMLENMDGSRLTGLLLDWIDSDKIYSFDTEITVISTMYSDFLERIEKLAKGDIEFRNKTEIFNGEAEKEIHTIQFQCKEKEYIYRAKSDGDWFDTEIFAFLNQVIAEQKTGKYLFICGDGYQNCIVFYETEEWLRRFNEKMDVQLERP